MASGIVRRVDSLGRVVIPKEIRKVLKIKENEQLEIKVDDDKIILSKYSDIHDYDKSINNLVNVIKDISNKDIIITNLNKIVITSKDYKDYLGIELNSYLLNILDNRKYIEELTPNNLKITDKEINVSYVIKPIIVHGDTIGLIMMLSNTNISRNDLNLLVLLENYLINYLE